MKLGTTIPNLKIVTIPHIQRNRAKGVIIIKHTTNWRHKNFQHRDQTPPTNYKQQPAIPAWAIRQGTRYLWSKLNWKNFFTVKCFIADISDPIILGFTLLCFIQYLEKVTLKRRKKITFLAWHFPQGRFQAPTESMNPHTISSKICLPAKW